MKSLRTSSSPCLLKIGDVALSFSQNLRGIGGHFDDRRLRGYVGADVHDEVHAFACRVRTAHERSLSEFTQGRARKLANERPATIMQGGPNSIKAVLNTACTRLKHSAGGTGFLLELFISA